MFAALSVRNFRLYFIGQMVSVSGTWMQRVAQAWLVLELTGSGTAVGAVTALQFLPLLIVAPFGGLVADRVNKRRLLFLTQSLAGSMAAILGVLVAFGLVELWMVYLLAFALGLVGSFDNPARQAFVMEMVGRTRITNAVGLNSVLVNVARILGPAVAGVLIVTLGIGLCFLLNAVSYLALITALAIMRDEELDHPGPRPRERGQLRDSFAYVRSTPRLFVPLLMMAVISLFSYEFEVVLPLMARFSFGGDADTFGLMFAVMGVGAVVGGLYTASSNDRPAASLSRIVAIFGVAMLAVSLAPNLGVALMGLAVVGATGTSFLAMGNSVLQLTARPEMRGRVLALRAVAFLGARPLGAPVVGWISEHLGPRYGMGIGALAAILVGITTHRRLAATDSSSTNLVRRE